MRDESDAVSEPGYYRSTGSSRGRSTPGGGGRRTEQRQQQQQSSATSPHYRRGGGAGASSSVSLSGDRTPSSVLRRSLAEHSSNDEKVRISIYCACIWKIMSVAADCDAHC
jgi:hypothetical protein